MRDTFRNMNKDYKATMVKFEYLDQKFFRGNFIDPQLTFCKKSYFVRNLSFGWIYSDTFGVL